MNNYATALQVALENYQVYCEGLEVRLKELRNVDAELYQKYLQVCKDFDQLSDRNGQLEKSVSKLEDNIVAAWKRAFEKDAELNIALVTIRAERENTTSWMETAGALSDKIQKLQEQLDSGDDETCYDYEDNTREAY